MPKKNLTSGGYQILFDYRTEGFSFHDESYATVEQAVKAALALNNYTPFLIVQVINSIALAPEEPKT